MPRSPAAGACSPGLPAEGSSASSSTCPAPASADKDSGSNGASSADTVSRLVMAEQITHDVVNEAQSMGGPSPIDVNASATNDSSAGAAPDSNQASSEQPAISSTNPTPPSDPPVKTTPPPDSSDGAKASPATDGSGKQQDHDAATEKSREPAVNGIATSQSLSDDPAGLHAAADTSGGSDTDTSRAGKDGVKTVKKPTSFKSVSVTKNFLAKTAVSAPAKTGDKAPTSQAPSSMTPPTAKPRLVAKSGSGMGSSIGRSGLSKLNGTGTGPDPNMVWNKNRPTPPPPPKQFTDEELKQQFGIHMATRLQTDEDTKESKWADIDEDEDDWAPETVEWMDGTKSTVKPAEPSPPLEEPKAEVKEEKPAEESKPAAQPISRPTSTGPTSTGGTKTILKPGVHAATGQTKQGGLLSRGQSDNGKPTLVAKSPAPTPAKSPWATLPPIEKISPVVTQTQPDQTPISRFSQKDPHGFDALPPAPSLAKEIAADDFNRSWRNDRGPRELFNSQSGRYEPVRDTRRGASRQDASFHQPSVLQRPSHAGPAEPSAAFQTSRSSVDEPWARRRTSSNVSGGSGRRMSFSRDVPPPSLRDRRGSQSTAEMPPPMSTKSSYQRSGLPSERGLSPAASNQGSWTQRSSPVAAHAQPVSPQASTSSPVPPDANGAPSAFVAYQEQVKIQEQMMRDKIERARAEKQKRKEEEEKEEAARKERLRLKLEALGPPPSKAEKSKSPPPSTETSQAQQKPATIQSPPKPPVPTAEGEVAQYGMMKVHQPQPVKRANIPAVTERHANEQALHLRPAEQRREGRSPERKRSSPEKQSAVPVDDAAKTQPDGVPASEENAGAQGAPEALEKKVPAWKPSVAQGTPWSSMRRHNMGGNVWGPPNQERGIGNGTFGHTQQAVQPQAPAAPGPIAPPPATTKMSTSPSPFTQPPSTEQPPSSFATQPDLRSQTSIANNATAMASAAAAPPGPIAPPKAQRQPFDASAWSANSIAESDAKLARMREEKYQANRGKPLPAFNETFKKTAMEGSLDRRRVLKTESVVRLHSANATPADGSLSEPAAPAHRTEQSSRTTPVPFNEPNRATAADEPTSLRPIGSEKVQSSPGSTSAQGSRSSRFFPRAQNLSDASTATLPIISITDDIPPPPETSSHPAFTGDAQHPIVKLPQKIKVKLPPASSHSTQSSPVTMPARPGFQRLGSQPIVAQPGWQERINGLLGRPSHPALSPPKPPATSLAVASASKAPFDHTASRAEATVSLPSKPAFKIATYSFVTTYDNSPVSKSAFEEVMSVPEAFSAPTVRLPKEPHMNAGLSPVAPPASRPGSRFYKTTEVFSIDPNYTPVIESEQNAQGIVITIHMPESETIKTRIMPRRRNPGRKPSGFNKKRNMAPRENSNSGPRSRKTSGSVPTQGHPWGNSNHKTNSPGSPWNRRSTGAVH